MAELKGLLDSAKRKLGGLLGGLNEYNDAFNDRAYSLLGNAPQQFNAGAAAGTAGSLGDAAYIARLPEYMLAGSMPDPRTIPGTSDYIAAQAGVPAPEGFLENAAWIGGQLLAPGPGELGAAGMAGGKLAMFLGAKAKTAMPDVLEYAQAMEKAGKSADEIWQTTGKLGQPWFKGADGKWRFEISDDAAKLTPQAAKSFVPGLANLNNKFDASLPDFMTHEGVINAYPFAKNIGVKSDFSITGGGSYSDAPSPLATDGTSRLIRIAQAGDDPLSTGLHEVQHSIQRAEGFARGGSPDDPEVKKAALDKLLAEAPSRFGEISAKWENAVREHGSPLEAKKQNPELFKSLLYWDKWNEAVKTQGTRDSAQGASMIASEYMSPGFSMEAYRRLAGEAEARNVQSRMNMSMDERIALPPWTTQDVPTEQQIVRFGDGPAMAIPFWHGSPHKYDAVDLSKIGTGEGAQAYGWGYYGAENPSVARGYRDALGNQVFNVDGKQVAPNSDEAIIATELEASPIDAVKAKFQKEAEKAQSLADQTGSKKMQAAADNFNRWLSRIDEVAAKQVQIDNTGNLYKGEYRWPDPAKEASTPLTGEDLLQWDRPLSEQPENVRRYFEPLVAPEREALAVPAGPEWGDLAVMPPYDPTGRELVVNILSRRVNPEHGKLTVDAVLSGGTGGKAASDELKRAGIPGIRYLDGMSRDGGQGTYNYVFFNQDGINLLERNGSPIEKFAERRAGKSQPYKESVGSVR